MKDYDLRSDETIAEQTRRHSIECERIRAAGIMGSITDTRDCESYYWERRDRRIKWWLSVASAGVTIWFVYWCFRIANAAVGLW